MATQKQLADQLDSLAKSFLNRSRSDAHIDNECQRYSMTCSDNIGYLDPQLQYQYNPYAVQQHQYYPEPFNVYPSHPVHEPQSYESSDLRDMPTAYLGSNATLLSSYNPLEQLMKEQEDMLRRCTDKLSEYQTLAQEESKKIRDQVTTDHRLQEDEGHPHTTSTLKTDYHSHEFGCKISSNPSPTQSSKSSLPPILNLSTSETDEEFILEELSESLQLETSGRSDEYDLVDEEIELESPEMEICIEDSASEGPEECTPTLSSDLISIQNDMDDTIPQHVVVDDITHILLDESPTDLVEPSTLDQPVAQVVNENVATRLETLMDSVPPPCPEYNIIIDPKTIGRKEGFASWFPSLHHIMAYTSWSNKDSVDQPILSIQPSEILKVERFVIPPVKPFPHFETSPYIGHTLIITCFKLLGMYQYYPLCLLMDARKPLGLPNK